MDVPGRAGKPGLRGGTDSPGFSAARLSAMGRHPNRAMALILLLALGFWLWFGLTQRSIVEDDGLSILAAQGILEHGVMRLPSEVLYHRGYIPHYLLAASLYAFGTNDFAIMLPSLLLALGTLWLMYLFARDVLAKPWVGVMAAALLLALESETFYATSARMYMGLQFFTMAAAYFAWRGYVRGSHKFQLLTTLALAAALLSTRVGAGLFVAIPISLLSVLWLGRPILPRITLQQFAGILILGGVVYFILFFGFDRPVGTVADAGEARDRTGLHLDLSKWADHMFGAARTLPYTMMFLPLAAFLAVRWRVVGQNHGLVFSLVIVGTVGAVTAFYVKTPAVRFWLHIVPIYSLVVCLGVVGLIEDFGAPVWQRAVRGLGRWQSVAVPLGAGTAVALIIAYLVVGAPGLNRVKPAFVPCQGKGQACEKGIEEHYAHLRQAVGPGDLVISTNPHLTNYYLGRVDGLLREKIVGNGFTEYSFANDDYLGLPLVDTIDELRNLERLEVRVWIIGDRKLERLSSERTRSFLESRFTPYRKDSSTTTYVNCAEPSCAGRSNVMGERNPPRPAESGRLR